MHILGRETCKAQDTHSTHAKNLLYNKIPWVMKERFQFYLGNYYILHSQMMASLKQKRCYCYPKTFYPNSHSYAIFIQCKCNLSTCLLALPIVKPWSISPESICLATNTQQTKWLMILAQWKNSFSLGEYKLQIPPSALASTDAKKIFDFAILLFLTGAAPSGTSTENSD